jgi:hypothetical protein
LDGTSSPPYYYLNLTILTTEPAALKPGEYNFYQVSYFADGTTMPSWEYAANQQALEDYWDTRGVNAAALPSTWQGQMWRIINGELPIFILKYDGTDFMLVDGLLRAIAEPDEYLRINGDYLLGSFTYRGEIADVNDLTRDLAVGITFK